MQSIPLARKRPLGGMLYIIRFIGNPVFKHNIDILTDGAVIFLCHLLYRFQNIGIYGNTYCDKEGIVMNEKLMDILKVIADKRIENTMDILLNNNQKYRKMAEAVLAIEKVYDSLEMDSDIREITDHLLAERDGMNLEKVSLAYWAGMMDAVLILREMGVIEL